MRREYNRQLSMLRKQHLVGGGGWWYTRDNNDNSFVIQAKMTDHPNTSMVKRRIDHVSTSILSCTLPDFEEEGETQKSLHQWRHKTFLKYMQTTDAQAYETWIKGSDSSDSHDSVLECWNLVMLPDREVYGVKIVRMPGDLQKLLDKEVVLGTHQKTSLRQALAMKSDCVLDCVLCPDFRHSETQVIRQYIFHKMLYIMNHMLEPKDAEIRFTNPICKCAFEQKVKDVILDNAAAYYHLHDTLEYFEPHTADTYGPLESEDVKINTQEMNDKLKQAIDIAVKKNPLMVIDGCNSVTYTSPELEFKLHLQKHNMTRCQSRTCSDDSTDSTLKTICHFSVQSLVVDIQRVVNVLLEKLSTLPTSTDQLTLHTARHDMFLSFIKETDDVLFTAWITGSAHPKLLDRDDIQQLCTMWNMVLQPSQMIDGIEIREIQPELQKLLATSLEIDGKEYTWGQALVMKRKCDEMSSAIHVPDFCPKETHAIRKYIFELCRAQVSNLLANLPPEMSSIKPTLPQIVRETKVLPKLVDDKTTELKSETITKVNYLTTYHHLHDSIEYLVNLTKQPSACVLSMEDPPSFLDTELISAVEKCLEQFTLSIPKPSK